jgi:porphobilinogen synthase
MIVPLPSLRKTGIFITPIDFRVLLLQDAPMTFPDSRPRRLRANAALRNMVRETTLTSHDLVLPLFVVEGKNQKKAIRSMPGVWQMSRDQIVKEAKTLTSLQIPAVILFGVPKKKDKKASSGIDPHGVVQETVRALKDKAPNLVVMTDVCLCEYMDHGHCGIVKKGKRFEIANDETLEVLGEMALTHAEAGADVVAPSDMMDGRVGYIRQILDESGHSETPILSYAVKYASAFYGPFREAAGSTPQFGDRRSYQMDPGNQKEAMKEAFLDIQEGADMLMVKPALPYLDILSQLNEEFDVPIAGYQVSGEYAMIKAASQKGWLDEESVMMESLLSIKRAGASFILTYFAKQAAKIL